MPVSVIPEHLAGLMLGEHAGDVVIDHDHLVDLAEPLLGEHADRRRAAADAHALFHRAVDDGRAARLHDDAGAAIDRHLDRLAVAEIEQRLAGDAAFFFAAMRQMIDAAEREHLRAVFAGRDVPDRLAGNAHGSAFRPEIAVGVDLQLHAAIGVDALGDDGHHVDAVDLRGDDERRRLVIGIGRAGADRGHERRRRADNAAIPIGGLFEERHDRAAFDHGALKQDMRIDADELAVAIGVAVAGAEHARLDEAHDRTGIAADLVVGRGGTST